MMPIIAAKNMAGKETVDSSMLSARYPLDLFFRDARPAAPSRGSPALLFTAGKYSFDGAKTAPTF
jgi:hypothetical protein